MFSFVAAVQAVSIAAWVASFLMIVPIFLYANESEIGPAEATGSNVTSTATTASMEATTMDADHLLPSPMTPLTSRPANRISCNMYFPDSEHMPGLVAFTIYTFTLAFAIPLVLIMNFYILVIRKLQVPVAVSVLCHVGPMSLVKNVIVASSCWAHRR